MHLHRALLAVVLTAWSVAARGAELGDPAPPLTVSAWVRGGPVDLAAGRGTNIFVVEFWATWCGSCRTSIRQLTALQNRFRDRGVVIVGVTRDPAKSVRPFVEEQGDAMNYAVALDDDLRTTRAWLHAWGEDGVPHAFLVDRAGRVVWHGHTLDGLDTALTEVVENRFDLAAARRDLRHEADVNAYFARVIAGDHDGARELGLRLVGDATVRAKLLNEFAWIVLTHPRIVNRDLDLALQAARAATERSRSGAADILDTYARALFASGRAREAIDQQRKAVATASDPTFRSTLERTLRDYETSLQ